MLLKVSDGVQGWHLIDNVDHAHLSAKSFVINKATELKNIGGDDALILISKDCFGVKPVSVGIIEFRSKDITRNLLFTNIVYVLNSKGDTLDRFQVSK